MDRKDAPKRYYSRGRRPAGTATSVAYPPRAARRGRARHAKPSAGLLGDLWGLASAWLASRRPTAARRRGRRRVAHARPAGVRLQPLIAKARRYSSHLSAAAGIVIILLSVYLVRAGIMAPSSVPFASGGLSPLAGEDLPGTAAPAEASGGGGASPATTDSTGATSQSATEPATGTAETTTGSDTGAAEGGTDAAETGTSAGAEGGTSTGATDESQPVLEPEGTSAPAGAGSGPSSVGEILSSLRPPASGEVVRGYGFYSSATFSDWRFHSGVDIALTAGAQVRAAASGMVVEVKGSSFEGWRVVIGHGLGVVTVYSQLGAASVAEGDSVEAGQTIGLAGAPGSLEADLGVHLHYELRLDDQATDPTPYLE